MACMDNNRLPKQTLFSQLSGGTRHRSADIGRLKIHGVQRCISIDLIMMQRYSVAKDKPTWSGLLQYEPVGQS